MSAPSAPPPCSLSQPLYDVPYFSTPRKPTHQYSTHTFLMIYSAFMFTACCFITTYIVSTFMLFAHLIIFGFLFCGAATRSIWVLRIQKVITIILQILNIFGLLILFNLTIAFLVLAERREFRMYFEENFPGYQWNNVAELLFFLYLGVFIDGLELLLRSYLIKKSIRVIRAESQQLQQENPEINV